MYKNELNSIDDVREQVINTIPSDISTCDYDDILSKHINFGVKLIKSEKKFKTNKLHIINSKPDLERRRLITDNIKELINDM